MSRSAPLHSLSSAQWGSAERVPLARAGHPGVSNESRVCFYLAVTDANAAKPNEEEPLLPLTLYHGTSTLRLSYIASEGHLWPTDVTTDFAVADAFARGT